MNIRHLRTTRTAQQRAKELKGLLFEAGLRDPATEAALRLIEGSLQSHMARIAGDITSQKVSVR